METNKTNEFVGVSSDKLAEEAVKQLLEKKAIDVKMFCVKESTSITDYYVNATGRSSTNVMALADEVTEKIGELGRHENRVEGRSGRSWLLVDYGDVIVNVFDRPSREFYNFDRLFSEDARVDVSDIEAEIDKKYDINNVKED